MPHAPVETMTCHIDLSTVIDLWERGLSVVPVKFGGKHPRVEWKVFQSRRATRDELEGWFGNGDLYNIGIVTGTVSGVVAIDCDSPEAIAWADTHLPKTPMVTRTARGEHRFYRHPGHAVRNQARVKTGDPLIKIDVRGDGGFVVGPGSVHESGVMYERVGTWPPIDDLPMFDPAWLESDVPADRPCAVSPKASGPSAKRRARRYLAESPGAVQGEGGDQHTFVVACRLVRDFGLDDADALELLREWNTRCRPPWTDDDLQKKICNAREYGNGVIGSKRDSHRATGRGRTLEELDLDDEPLPTAGEPLDNLPPSSPRRGRGRAKRWKATPLPRPVVTAVPPSVAGQSASPPSPVELPAEVRALLPATGFLREYVEYAFPLTDAPVESHLATALVIISSLVGTRVKIPFGPGSLHLNLWVVVVGLSSYGRKTTAQRMGSDIVREVEPACILPADTTPQALFDLLMQRSDRVLFLSEFSWLLQQIELKFNAGMKPLMTDLFDVPPCLEKARVGAARGQTQRVNNPYLTILAATTAPWLNKHLNDGDLSGGFYARFTYWPAGDKRGRRLAIPPRPDPKIRDELIDHARMIAQLQGDLELHLIADRYDQWHAQHAAEFVTLDDRDRLGPFWTRLETACLKLAALHQLSCAPTTGGQMPTAIEPWALDLAIKLVAWLKTDLVRLFKEELATTPYGVAEQKILGIVRAHGRISRRDLQRKTGFNPVGFNTAVNVLLQDERLTQTDERTPKGQTRPIVTLGPNA